MNEVAQESHRIAISHSNACPCEHSWCYRILLEHQRSMSVGKPLLTEEGEARLRSLAETSTLKTSGEARDSLSFCLVPLWDGIKRELWLGSRCIKVFRQPAHSQTEILNAFQAENWQTRIEFDFQPPREGESPQNAKRRLHASLQNLNRSLPANTIRFHGDGTGLGLRWELIAETDRLEFDQLPMRLVLLKNLSDPTMELIFPFANYLEPLANPREGDLLPFRLRS